MYIVVLVTYACMYVHTYMHKLLTLLCMCFLKYIRMQICTNICTCEEGCHHFMSINTLMYHPGGQNCWTARSLVLWFTVHGQGRLHHLAETEQESKLKRIDWPTLGDVYI